MGVDFGLIAHRRAGTVLSLNWPFITFFSADPPSETPSLFNSSKPLPGDLTPNPLSSSAATPRRGEGEPERASSPPLHEALRSNA